MKLAVCNEMFEGWEWERVCDTARDIGYQGIEIAPFTFALDARQIMAAQRQHIRAVAEQRGLAICGLHWLLVGPAGLHLTHPDPQVRDRSAAYFIELVNLCADLGGRVLVVGSPKQRDLLPGVTTEQAMEWAIDVFRPCLDIAAGRDVVLALEPLGPKTTTFIQTATEAVDLIERIAHPAFRLNLDIKAMADEATPIPEIIRASAHWLEHVQLNDPNLLGPGMGDLDHVPILAALREVDYQGWLSVEVFDFTPGGETIARKSHDYVRQYL